MPILQFGARRELRTPQNGYNEFSNTTQEMKKTYRSFIEKETLKQMRWFSHRISQETSFVAVASDERRKFPLRIRKNSW